MTRISDVRLTELIELHDGLETATALRELRAYRNQPFSLDEAMRFDNSPCFICGYNGESYYQPAVHACAKRYHAHHEPAAAAPEPQEEP